MNQRNIPHFTNSPGQSIDRTIELVFPARIVGDVRSAKCSVKRLSDSGVVLDVGRMRTVPDHFYLQLPGEEKPFGGCYVKRRIRGHLYCGFLGALSAREFERIMLEQDLKLVLNRNELPAANRPDVDAAVIAGDLAERRWGALGSRMKAAMRALLPRLFPA